MSSSPQRAGVELPAGRSGSQFFLDALRHAADRYPDALAAANLPNEAARFKADYPETVTAFEAARLASSQRGEIAETLVDYLNGSIQFVDGEERPLREAVAADRTPLTLTSEAARGAPRWQPQLEPGPDVAGLSSITHLLDNWHERHLLTDAAAEAVSRSLDRASDTGINLAGERFVLMGAGAEVAPTRLLLEAGADILWLDIRPPDTDLLNMPARGGITWAPEGADLLQAPGRIRQTILEFADGKPVHLGLFAYAPGEGRELRMAASMNTIVDALPGDIVASVSLLISPTSPMPLMPEDIDAATSRRDQRPVWQAMLDRLGRLGAGPLQMDDVAVARCVVPLQGAAYQAAQYLTKRLAAEAWFRRGAGTGQPLPNQAISANIAPITSTRSLSHPLFQAGFAGAGHFGVHISAPATTRRLSCLLMLDDLLTPASQACRPADGTSGSPEQLTNLSARQIHGGIAGLPYTLQPSITVAALIGLVKRPGLLAGFFR